MDTASLRGKTFKGVFWKFFERSFAQMVSLLVSIILARILDPDNYVLISIVTIFFTFANAIISGGLSTALIQKKDADQKDYSSVFWVSSAIALLIYAILSLAAPLIADLYGRGDLVAVIRVMGVVLIINNAKSVFGAYISSHLMFRRAFYVIITSSIISAIVGITMALKGYGVWALVFQQISAGVVDLVLFALITRLRILFYVSLARVKQLFKYGSGIFAATIIGVIYEEISPLIIGLKFESSHLSFYDKGKSFPSLINSACNDTLMAVLFPVMTKVQDDLGKVLALTRRFIKTSSFLVFPLMMGFFCVADTFVSVILTDKWMPATIYIRIFAMNYLLNFVQMGNLQAIKAIGRSDIIFKLECIKKTIYTIVLFVFILFAKSPVVIALAAVVNVVIATLINTRPNRKLIGYSYADQIRDVLPNFLLSLLMGVVVVLLGFVPIAKPLLLVVQVLGGAMTYGLLAILLKNESFFYMFDLVKAGLKRETH